MAIADRAAAFLSQMGSNVTPMLAKVGGTAAKAGANVAQSGANLLADVGDAALRKNKLLGQMTAALPAASNALHASSQMLSNIGQTGQVGLGASVLGTGVLGVGAVAGLSAMQHQRYQQRKAGQELGAQLGVAMPPKY